MTEAMSSAELTEQFVELLAARTVLSLSSLSLSGPSPWHAVVGGTTGAHGNPGIPGDNGPSVGGQSMSNGPDVPHVVWALFGQSDPGPGLSHGLGDAISHNG